MAFKIIYQLFYIFCERILHINYNVKVTTLKDIWFYFSCIFVLKMSGTQVCKRVNL